MKTPRDMMMALLILALLPAVAGCGRQEAPPAPVPIDDQASGYFCGMLVLAHPGPKAQIWIAGRDHPLWFTSVRDAFSYLQAGEREGRIIAFYVQDMGRAESWAHPGRDFFIPADRALYVWGSDRKGGMGAPELVP
ncbi:MAG: copper resistance protein CopZ, partial [Alphaproteobacteria bacterium]